jgi:hypothetical protein
MRIPIVLLVSWLGLTEAVVAQDSSGVQREPRRRTSLTYSALLLTGMPGYRASANGLLAGVAAGLPAGASDGRWVLGIGYGILFPSPAQSIITGAEYSARPEGLLAALGREWMESAGSATAFDLQWNPGFTHVRRSGDGIEAESTPWGAVLTAFSAGVRVVVRRQPYPIVSLTGRLFMDASSESSVGGSPHFWLGVGLSLQPR